MSLGDARLGVNPASCLDVAVGTTASGNAACGASQMTVENDRAHRGFGRMTIRVYLQAAHVAPGPPVEGDLPAERVFVHASELPEVWVETESASVPDRGRSVSFALARTMGIGFERITGTVERTLHKGAHRTVANTAIRDAG